ncbi:MAG: hypothetical protein NC414_02775 [Bacteroidales bacterium]|nr:hypothetical protein [Bacteroidales bacterium]
MLRKVIFLVMIVMATTARAQKVTALWSLNDTDDLTSASLEGDNAAAGLMTTAGAVGEKLTVTGLLTSSGADTGYTSVTYDRPMTKFQPAAEVKAVTSGYCVSFTVNIAEGHTFKPTHLSFDAARCGTDKGTICITTQTGNEPATTFAEGVTPLRNKITAGNSTGFSTHEYNINGVIVEGTSYTVNLYIMGIGNTKQIAMGSVAIEGVVDEPVYDMSHYLTAFTCRSREKTIDLYPLIKNSGNGVENLFRTKLTDAPSDFIAVPAEGFTAEVGYADNIATVTIKEDGNTVYTSAVHFMISNIGTRGEAKPLNRGLLAVHTDRGNLVSWRMRATDVPGTTLYKLYREGELIQTLKTKTNFMDSNRTSGTIYRIDVCNAAGEVMETQEASAWDGQNTFFTLPQAPTDTNGTGATYTPNDATCYDMDGDGEQEIVIRWEPSNAKDGAGTGATGAVFLDCVKLDGTHLWRINLGKNMWASQHTITFLCYDFDGDGYGEMIVRTAPGTIDGEGNFVLMGDDDPYTSHVAANGRVESGPEYLTVFDGTTGGAISSIHYWPAHDDFSNNISAYGSQARIERYNATMARLDVNGKATPCAVMNHGYYSQAYYMAAYFDGKELHELWRHSSTTNGKGMYGQGYHTLQSADVDNDGFDEIVADSAVLDHDGVNVLWRSGEGHGDALHIGDFDWENPGMEVYSVMEDYEQSYVHYGQDMRDAKTGTLLWGTPKGSKDCGRGLCGDFDDKHDGAESMCTISTSMFDSKGEVIGDWQVGTTTSSSLNFRIYWDGDLYDEYHDRQHIDKWDSDARQWGRLTTLYKIEPGAESVNGTKSVPSLQADMLGDWREEVVYYYTIDASAGKFGLNIITTDYESDYMLPYLRDDHLYDNAIVWQNSTYNQPPHISYSPVLYWKELQDTLTGIRTVTVPEAEGGNTMYNIAGQRIAPSFMQNGGIVIRNGKKIMM